MNRFFLVNICHIIQPLNKADWLVSAFIPILRICFICKEKMIHTLNDHMNKIAKIMPLNPNYSLN